MTKFDISTPIDVTTAIQGLGGESRMFYKMLESLEKMTLNETMLKITDAYDAKNYKVLKELAHALKGACAYIGASRLHYVCFFMQEHFIQERYEKVVDLYPSLVEAAIEYKVYSREILAKHKGENYQRLSEHEYVPIPSDFRLEKDPSNSYIYCCFKNQPLN